MQEEPDSVEAPTLAKDEPFCSNPNGTPKLRLLGNDISKTIQEQELDSFDFLSPFTKCSLMHVLIRDTTNKIQEHSQLLKIL